MDDQAQAVGSIDDRIMGAMGLLPVEEKPPEEEAARDIQQEEPDEEPAQEAEQPQAEESAPVQEPEEGPPAWEEVKAIKLKVPLKNGDEERDAEVTIDELRLGYMRQDDYQRKTQEVSKVKQTAHEEAMRAVAQLQERNTQELKALDAFITQIAAPEMQGVNWNTLATTDPAEFVRLSHRANQLQTIKQQVSQKLQQADQQRIQQSEAQRAQALQQAQAQLAAEIPNWNESLQQALVKSGREYGYTDDELAKIDDPRLVKILHAAHQWATLQSKGPIAEKKVSAVPKILKSGAQPSRSEKRWTHDEILRTRIKKSGGRDKAAVEELIKSRLG